MPFQESDGSRWWLLLTTEQAAQYLAGDHTVVTEMIQLLTDEALRYQLAANAAKPEKAKAKT